MYIPINNGRASTRGGVQWFSLSRSIDRSMLHLRVRVHWYFASHVQPHSRRAFVTFTLTRAHAYTLPMLTNHESEALVCEDLTSMFKHEPMPLEYENLSHIGFPCMNHNLLIANCAHSEFPRMNLQLGMQRPTLFTTSKAWHALAGTVGAPSSSALPILQYNAPRIQ